MTVVNAVLTRTWRTRTSTRDVQWRQSWPTMVITLTVIALLLMEILGGFLLEQRAQTQLAARFRGQAAIAASAYGQPGLSPLPDSAPLLGDPVAVVEIPALALTHMALEGATSQRTRNGLGHLVGTPLPGDAGHSVLVGRRSTFGAPFRFLPTVPEGSVITVTTIQGQSTYKVLAKDVDPDALPANVLELRTASSVLAASGTVSVFAELQGSPYQALPRNNAASDAGSSPEQALLVIQLVVLMAFLAPRFAARFSRGTTWLVIGIPFVGAMAALALVIDGFLPSAL